MKRDAALCALVLVACEVNDPTARVTAVNVEGGIDTLRAIGAQTQFVATATDAAGVVVPGVGFRWSSSVPAVARIDNASGLATADGNGATIITVTAGAVTASRTLAVLQRPTAVAVTGLTDTMPSLGDTRQLTAIVKDSNGVPIAGAPVAWSSTAPTLVSVTGTGLATAAANGTATIIATLGTLADSVELVVRQVVASIVAPPLITPLIAGDSVQLVADPRDARGHTVPDAVVTWAPNVAATAVSPPILTVGTSTGRVRGVRLGEASVIATSGASQAAVPVSVRLRFAELGLGNAHSCGRAGGLIYCWGGNEYAQLGNGTSGNTFVTSPGLVGPTVARRLRVGSFHACASEAATSAVICWGWNQAGQIGDGSTTNRPSPVTVAGGLLLDSIDAGQGHNCALIGTQAYCWGDNHAWQIGDGTNTQRNTPYQVIGNVPFISITAGTLTTCALKADSTAYCWGGNVVGVGGSNTNGGASLTSPTPVNSSARFSQIRSSGLHSCAITAAGAAYCWGNNVSGELGLGTIDPDNSIDRTTPAPVTGGLAFTAIALGNDHTCAVTTAGAAYCWGRNLNGQLGNGSTTSTGTPTPVSGGLVFSAIFARANNSCGLAANGLAYCWGQNALGSLGNGDTGPRLVPAIVLGQ